MASDKILKLISAYWCNHFLGSIDDRFEWAWEEVFMAAQEISTDTVIMLLCLGESAFDERTAAYFAAGPLENYINLIVREKRAKEALEILNVPLFKNNLSQVWGDVQELAPLAATYSGKAARPILPDLGLRAFSLSQIARFWVSTCVSSNVDEYHKAYEATLELMLKRRKDQARMKEELVMSAPDDKAVDFLNMHVFSVLKYR